MAGNSAEPGRSVTSKIIAILRGVLERTSDAQYGVGLPLQVIGSRAVQTPTTYEWARRSMDDLSAATHSDVRFGYFEDLDVAYMEKVVGQHSLSLHCGAAALPAHATALGKALLAFSATGTVDRVIARGLKRYTAYTLTTGDRLRRSLAVVRLRCIAVSRWQCSRAAPRSPPRCSAPAGGSPPPGGAGKEPAHRAPAGPAGPARRRPQPDPGVGDGADGRPAEQRVVPP